MGTHLASGLIEEDDGVVSKVDSGGHFELHDSSKEIMLLLEEGIKATLEKNPEGVLKLLAQL